MNKFNALLVWLCLGVVCIVGGYAVADPGMVVFDRFTTIATNSATSGIVTNETVSVTKYVDAVVVDISGTSTNVDIDIITKASSGSGPSRTILSTNDFTADLVLYPRVTDLHSTVGGNVTVSEGVRIPLVGDVLQCWLQAENTGVTARVWVYLSDQP